MERCVKCSNQTAELRTNAFGEKRCEHCWEDYLTTDRGKVEYFLSTIFDLLSGSASLDDFDADFLIHIIAQWKKYKSQLALSSKEIMTLEDIAKNIGLLTEEDFD